MLKFNNYFDIKWLVIAVAFTAIILLLTHIPKEAMPPRLQENSHDKLHHIVAYGAITFLLILSLRISFTLTSASFFFFAILVIGTIDEVTQPFVHRTASITDWLADIVGIIIVLFFFVCFKNTRGRPAISAE